MTLKNLIAANRIKADVVYGNKVEPDDWQKTAHPWTVTLKMAGKKLTVPFFTGSAWTKEPDVNDVLECLLSDYSLGQEDFEEFCANLGYDTDSRKAEKIYKLTQRQSAKLERFLGGDLEAFLYADRD